MSNYIDHLAPIAAEDARFLVERDKSYGSSWKKRGGIGAAMMLLRKVDRLEEILKKPMTYNLSRIGKRNITAGEYDVFAHIQGGPGGEDGTVLAEIRDLRRYLLLVEAEMVDRGVVTAPKPPFVATGKYMKPEDTENHAGPVPAEDSNKHAQQLRWQVNHSELMDLPREDQLRYKFVESE